MVKCFIYWLKCKSWLTHVQSLLEPLKYDVITFQAFSPLSSFSTGTLLWGAPSNTHLHCPIDLLQMSKNVFYRILCRLQAIIPSAQKVIVTWRDLAALLTLKWGPNCMVAELNCVDQVCGILNRVFFSNLNVKDDFYLTIYRGKKVFYVILSKLSPEVGMFVFFHCLSANTIF